MPTKWFSPFRRSPWFKARVNHVWKSWATYWSLYQNCPTLLNYSDYRQKRTFAELCQINAEQNCELALLEDLKYGSKRLSSYAQHNAALLPENHKIKVLKKGDSLSRISLMIYILNCWRRWHRSLLGPWPGFCISCNIMERLVRLMHPATHISE